MRAKNEKSAVVTGSCEGGERTPEKVEESSTAESRKKCNGKIKGNKQVFKCSFMLIFGSARRDISADSAAHIAERKSKLISVAKNKI